MTDKLNCVYIYNCSNNSSSGITIINKYIHYNITATYMNMYT